jgi:hypothetical protein
LGNPLASPCQGSVQLGDNPIASGVSNYNHKIKVSNIHANSSHKESKMPKELGVLKERYGAWRPFNRNERERKAIVAHEDRQRNGLSPTLNATCSNPLRPKAGKQRGWSEPQSRRNPSSRGLESPQIDYARPYPRFPSPRAEGVHRGRRRRASSDRYCYDIIVGGSRGRGFCVVAGS